MLWRIAPIALLLWGVAVFAYLLGAKSSEHRWFPYPAISTSFGLTKHLIREATGEVFEPYFKTAEKRTVILHRPQAVAPGMTLISGAGPQGGLFIKLIDAQGVVLHAWDTDWFKRWPDARHVPPSFKPKQRPGTMVHGMLLSPNGDVTYNYEGLGTVQLDVCGRTKWRLPTLTSHSLFRDEAGDLWSFDFAIRDKADPKLPGLGPPFFDYGVVKISADGRLLKRISITDLLIRNGEEGLLYLVTPAFYPDGDTLHVNSVEIFPSTLKSELFKAGDIMISLRNLDSVIVVDPVTEKIKAGTGARFIRQHDPHFVDGSTITVFDNNHRPGADGAKASSKLVAYSFKDGSRRVIFEGTPDHPFYTAIMGKQYRLANGDYLLSEAQGGRALEISASGEVLWEYLNHTRPGVVGLLTDAQRIPPSFLSAEKLKQLVSACPAQSR
jgi:hypothetical protein